MSPYFIYHQVDVLDILKAFRRKIILCAMYIIIMTDDIIIL